MNWLWNDLFSSAIGTRPSLKRGLVRITVLLLVLVPDLALSAGNTEPSGTSDSSRTAEKGKDSIFVWSSLESSEPETVLPKTPFPIQQSDSKAIFTSPTLESIGSVPPTSTPLGVVHETIIVVPDPEDLPVPEKNRWLRFEEALGPGRSASSQYRSFGWRNNDGTRLECYSPCIMNCCVGTTRFSLTGSGLGQ